MLYSWERIELVFEFKLNFRIFVFYIVFLKIEDNNISVVFFILFLWGAIEFIDVEIVM